MNKKQILDYRNWKKAEIELIELISKHIELDPNHKGYFRVELLKIGYKQKNKHEFAYSKGTKKSATEDIAHLIYFEDDIERLKVW